MKSFFLKTLAGFALLCALYAATYIFNDLNDLEADRAHPKKKNRPLANGDVPVVNAVILALALTAISLWLGYRLSPGFFHAELAIIAINIIYTKFLKKEVIVDVILIGCLFILRVSLDRKSVV